MNKGAIRRELFPITEQLVYVNHAAVGPLSERAYQAMEAHAREQRDVAALHWRDWIEEYKHFRDQAAQLLGAAPSEISILKNTTEGLSFVAEGLQWSAGDNVITTNREFPSNYAPWKRLERRGVECREIDLSGGTFSVADVEALIDHRTRLVAISSVSFHNGFRPELEAIGELCASRNVFLCVDGIQSLGCLETNVREAKISFLAADAHKWLLGPEGCAVFFCAAEHRDRLDVTESGWLNVKRHGESFFSGEVSMHEDSRRFEGGSLNTNGVYGATAAMELLNEIGVGEIEREVLHLANRLADGLDRIGFEVKTARPCRSGIVSAVPSGVVPEKVAKDLSPQTPKNVLLYRIHDWLEKRGIICSPREGMLRFSPHFYNSDEEMETIVGALKEIVG